MKPGTIGFNGSGIEYTCGRSQRSDLHNGRSAQVTDGVLPTLLRHRRPPEFLRA
jgi:hypothetical protein